MATVIIRHATSGEHFLAELDESGDAVALSAALPTYEARDDSHRVNWAAFEDADLDPWEDAADRWTADKFLIVHQFDGVDRSEFQRAIHERDWYAAAIMVKEYATESLVDSDGMDMIQDWMSHGSWGGTETPESVAREWDEYRREGD